MNKIKIRGTEIKISYTNDIRYTRHWKNVESGKWEPHTFDVFDKFLNKNKSYIDLGAWIGSTVLYGANISKHVYAVEPDVVALNHFIQNINLNSSLPITLYKGIVSDVSGMSKLYIDNADFGSSGSSVFHGGDKVMEVNSISFNDFVNKYDIYDCNFIKMDIEGSELIVLPTMKEYIVEFKPTLYLSLHHKFFSLNDLVNIQQALSVFNKFYNAEDLSRINNSEAVSLKSLIAEM